MNVRIKYISFFDFQDSKVARNYVTAATNKMESICESLNSCGYDVEIVSVSNVVEPKFKLFKGENVKRHDGLTLRLFPSWGGNASLSRKIKVIWHLTLLFFYLVFNTRKNEKVIVYHSLDYFNVILWAKKIRKFKMILEVEEIYQDVVKPKFDFMAKTEYRMINNADAYIFPTTLLGKKLNIHHKPSVIIHGTYKVEPQVVDKFEDGKIHVVYAGTFDPRKGGAAAAAAAAFLPENYHIHICGFGSKEDTDAIKDTIAEVAAKSKAKVSFHGLLRGREYIEFIQKCHIGLSTQNPSAAFNTTSFPSKILSYMANGLSVVSIDIPAIKTSAIGKYLNYYTEQTPENIAKAILSFKSEHDNRRIISNLEADFVREINLIMENS